MRRPNSDQMNKTMVMRPWLRGRMRDGGVDHAWLCAKLPQMTSPCAVPPAGYTMPCMVKRSHQGDISDLGRRLALVLPLASALASDGESDAWTLDIEAGETTKGRNAFLVETVMNNCNDAQSGWRLFGAHARCQGISVPPRSWRCRLAWCRRTNSIRYLLEQIASSCAVSLDDSRRHLLEACVKACCQMNIPRCEGNTEPGRSRGRDRQSGTGRSVVCVWQRWARKTEAATRVR